MAKPKPSDVLARAANLIEPEGAWCRDSTARRPIKDADKSEATLAGDPEATQWGGVGAIYKVGLGAGLTPQECFAIQEIAARSVGCARRWFSDWAWGFARTQAEVVSALRAASELAKAEGQ